LGPRPGHTTKAIEMAIVALASGVLLHYAEAIRRDIQLGALGIFQLHELSALVLDIEERHATIASYDIVDVHYTVAGAEGGKVVQELRATTRGRRWVLFLLTKNIGMAQDHQTHLGPDEALAQLAHAHQHSPGPQAVVGETGSARGDGAAAQLIRLQQGLHTSYFKGGMTQHQDTQPHRLPLAHLGDEAVQSSEELRGTMWPQAACRACRLWRVIPP